MSSVLNVAMSWPLSRSAAGHLYEVRLVLEPKAAELAATNAEPADLPKLEAALNRLEESWVT
jgi:DNA-binding FadR family transcriptional regulator